MSEASIFSIGAVVGDAAVGITKLISRACGVIIGYQPKNEYLATPEREMLLQTLYVNNFSILEDQFVTNNGIAVVKKPYDDAMRRAQIEAIHAVSMFESVSQIMPMAVVAQTKHKGNWEKISSAISKIKSELRTPTLNIKEISQLSVKSDELIRKITMDSHALLAEAENNLLLNTVSKSLSAFAYKLKSDGNSLIASKGSVCIRAKVDGGKLNLDTTSFPGISCHQEIRKIEKELEKRGLVLRRLCERSVKLRKESVRLKDPFPVLPANALVNSKSIRAKLKNNEINNQLTNGNYGLVQRYIQQIERNRIRERLL